MPPPNLGEIGYDLTNKIGSQIRYSKPVLSLNPSGITKYFGGIKDIQIFMRNIGHL